ncbi:metabotropic glutamate receptor 8-like [Homalodisca vitripennis]|uniref:metabotropic glutamate receptor 8-like n=1 Tax=Homalodisca vitripennis TaxID=197043 RepID=UPI001EEA2E7F|nr:metabotropic glutamate receptor 8-like [Homalodisca vitripennis]
MCRLAGAVTVVVVSLLQTPHCLARPYLNVSGEIMLGGLFPVHANGKGVTECGGVQVEDGMLMLEAMLFIVNEINERTDLLPDIKLGVIAYDTCDSPAYALEQSLDFIKGFIAHYNGNKLHTDHPKEFVCRDGEPPEYRGGNFDKVAALIGEQSSAVTMQIATMLRLFGTPIVSYLATSPALSNKDKFPTFFRTVPSDINQANAMLALISQMNWTYVSIVYVDTEYGNQGYETLNTLAPEYGVCFSTPLRVSNEHFSDVDYDRIVQKLANNSDARVVVVFAEKPTVVLRLVESTRRMKVGNRFVWVGSHGWTVTDHREHHLPIVSKLEDSLATVNRPNRSKLAN